MKVRTSIARLRSVNDDFLKKVNFEWILSEFEAGFGDKMVAVPPGGTAAVPPFRFFQDRNFQYFIQKTRKMQDSCLQGILGPL